MNQDYYIVRNVLDINIINFVYDYFKKKKKVATYLFNNNYIAPECEWYGSYIDKQIPNTYASYSDIVMETLLEQTQDTIELKINTKLIPTYSYARLYKNGDELHKHKDRKHCEISATMNLGGDKWPIYLEPNIKIMLNPSDILIYKGCKLEHWRKKFTGNECAQVFFHYNSVNNPLAESNKFDGRVFLGLPKFSTYE